MSLDNQAVVGSLKQGDYSVLRTIYKETQREFRQWVYSQYKVSQGDAEEIFQNTIIIFYEKVIADGFDLTSHWKTYLFAIGKNKVREHFRAAGKTSLMEELPGPDDIFEDEGPEVDDHTDLVIKCIDELGPPCKDLIVAYYYKKMALEEISSKLGYKNSNSAKNQKFKCVQRLKELFMERYKQQV